MLVLSHHPRCAFGVLDEQTFVALFDGECDRSDLRWMAQALADAPAEYNRVVMVMQGGCSFDSEARAYLAELMTGLDGQVLGWVVVTEGKGFWASASRSVMSNIRLISQSRFPFYTAGDLSAAAEWLSSSGHDTPALKLLELADRLRSSLVPHPLLMAN